MTQANALPALYPLHLNGGGLDVWCAAAQDVNGDVLLADCGGPDQWEQLTGALAEHGLSADRIRTVVLTHQDYDHMGNLKNLLKRYPDIQVICGRKEACYLAKEEPYLVLQRAAGAIQAGAPEALAMKDMLDAIPAVVPAFTVAEETRLERYGGIRLLPTPGHTPGHISVLFEAFDTLLSGDALLTEEGKLLGPNPIYTNDLAAGIRSLEVFKGRGIHTVICAHCGIFTGDADAALEALTC